MQLELFPKPYDEEIEDLKERYERLRKSQHARISGLQKDIKELKSELEFLKANICKGLLL
jgi:chaperonin cofactor prefoldin